jgi:predicted nuclease of predicted toxin-antitoxin system
MTLRFFVDQCVPGSIIQALREEGHEILRLKDSIAVDSPDPVVLAKAQELDAILLSLNGDFADIVSYPPADYKGIIALQVRNHPEAIPQLISRLIGFISSHPDRQYFTGKLLLIEAHRIRIRG